MEMEWVERRAYRPYRNYQRRGNVLADELFHLLLTHFRNIYWKLNLLTFFLDKFKTTQLFWEWKLSMRGKWQRKSDRGNFFNGFEWNFMIRVKNKEEEYKRKFNSEGVNKKLGILDGEEFYLFTFWKFICLHSEILCFEYFICWNFENSQKISLFTFEYFLCLNFWKIWKKKLFTF